MLDPDDVTASLEPFTERIPLFPLPGVVLFPHALLPLHIIEPRDCRLFDDALDSTGVIAVALLKPGWERLPTADVPPIDDTVCVGRIEACQRSPDGRYAVLLQGLARAVVLDEETSERSYRVARVALRSDATETLDEATCERLRREVLETFRDTCQTDRLDRLFHEAADSSLPLGTVCDVIASLLSLSTEHSQQLLAASKPKQRCDLLLTRLRELRQKARGKPTPPPTAPGFSVN